MIGVSRHRDAILALQHDMAAADARVGTLDERVATLFDQLTERTAHASDEADRVGSLIDRIAGLEAMIATQNEKLAIQSEALVLQSALADRQAAEITQLREGAERHDETIKQVRADLARMERQATIDLEEMRQTDAALAATFLRHQTRAI